MTKLCELAYKYGSDKCPQILHNYTPYYYKLLKGRRKTIKKVLEMGVGYSEIMDHCPNYQDGSSLRMWADFFPNAMVYGADIHKGCLFQTDRIKTFYCDETLESDLKNLIKQTGSDIDLFIDDGSHEYREQMFMCLTLMPMLKKDVIYIIEDVSDTNPKRNCFEQFDYQSIEFDVRQPSDRIVVIRNK